MLKARMFMVALLLVVCVSALPAKAALVKDDFNRDDNNTVGLMSDGIHKWYERENAVDGMRVVDDRLRAVYSKGYGVAVLNNDSSDYTLADGFIAVTLAYLSDAKFAHIVYRAENADAATWPKGGSRYSVQISLGGTWGDPTSRNVTLYYGGTVLSSASVANTTSEMLLVEVSFSGNRHIVSVGGTEMIDYTETESGRTLAGCIGLTKDTIYSHVHWDEFSVSVPEPATMGLLLLGLPFVLRRRR